MTTPTDLHKLAEAAGEDLDDDGKPIDPDPWPTAKYMEQVWLLDPATAAFIEAATPAVLLTLLSDRDRLRGALEKIMNFPSYAETDPEEHEIDELPYLQGAIVHCRIIARAALKEET